MVTGYPVGTSTDSRATWYPFQRKSFYAKGLHWVFYSDGSYMRYKVSSDGVNWVEGGSSPIRACTIGYMFSVWYDPVNDYLHYAYAPNTTGGDLMYKRGRPNADGTITWSTTAEQTAYDAAYVRGVIAEYIRFPFVSVDSNGYPWIGFLDFEAVEVTYTLKVTKSSTNDGTWSTASGFPYALAYIGGCVAPIPLTAGKMLVVYGTSSLTVKARAWNGSAWLTEVATTSAIDDDYAYSAVAQGDDVHLVFLKYTTFDIIYVKYSYASNSFGTETTLQSATTSTSAPVISIDPNTNDLYVLWAGPTANHIYYRKYNASTGLWELAVNWLDESLEALTDNDRLTTFYNMLGGYLGLAYMTKTTSPYNVKYAPPPTVPIVRFFLKTPVSMIYIG
jgi:hypothetical protein